MSAALAEIRFSGRRWLLLECGYVTERRYLLRISCRDGERAAVVEGLSIGDVLQRAIGWICEMISPRRLDYCRLSNPDLA